MVHRNIRIINNIFKMTNNVVLSARSVDRLLFTGNKIIDARFLKEGKDHVVITLTACKNVLIQKNNFDRTGLPLINTRKMTKADLKTDLKIDQK
jgi:hypothetical protein